MPDTRYPLRRPEHIRSVFGSKQNWVMVMRIIGMIPVYNESDIIEQVIQHLLSQGLRLVILDNGSNDGSYEICRRFLQRGVLSIERHWTERYEWRLMLQRLFTMALQHSPDWAVLSGADEFLESPYRGYTLGEAIGIEARKGHNLIQFDDFEFWPTEKDSGSPENDVRRRIKYYSWHDDFQFRCWKVYPGVVIHEQAGHRPTFPAGIDMKVSPNKFVLRHYKIRSYEHGVRKVFSERLPRYSPELRSIGWHVHYNNFTRDKDHFIIDASKLTKYNEDGNWNLTKTFDGTFGAWNPPSVPEQLDQARSEFAKTSTELANTRADLAKTSTELANTRADLAKTSTELANTRADLAKTSTELANTRADLAKTSTELANTRADLAKTSTDLTKTRAELEVERTRQESELAEKNITLDALRSELQGMQSQRAIALEELDLIRHSFGYKVMRFYGSLIDRLFGDNTLRGESNKSTAGSVGIGREKDEN